MKRMVKCSKPMKKTNKRGQGHHRGPHIVEQSEKDDKQNDVCDGYQIKSEPEEPSGVPTETPPFQVHIQVPADDGDSGGDLQSYMYIGGTCKSEEALEHVQHDNAQLAKLDIPYKHDEIRVVSENMDSLSVGKRIDAPMYIETVKAETFVTESAKISAANFHNSIYTASATNVIGHSQQPVEENFNFTYNQICDTSKTLSNEHQTFEGEKPLDLKDIMDMINTNHNYGAFISNQEQIKAEAHQDVNTPPNLSATGSSSISSQHNTERSGPQQHEQAETLLVPECLQVKQESSDLVKADTTVEKQGHEQVTCTYLCKATASTEGEPKEKARKLNIILQKTKSGTWKTSVFLASDNHSEKDLGQVLQMSHGSAMSKPNDLEWAQATDEHLQPWMGRNHTEGHSKNKCLADGSMPDKCTTMETVRRRSANAMHNQGNHSKEESIQTYHSNSRKRKLTSVNKEKSKGAGTCMDNKCKQYGKQFSSRVEYLHHVLGHKGAYGYVCCSCSFFCVGEDKLRRHVRKHAYILNCSGKIGYQDIKSSSPIEGLADIHMVELVTGNPELKDHDTNMCLHKKVNKGKLSGFIDKSSRILGIPNTTINSCVSRPVRSKKRTSICTCCNQNKYDSNKNVNSKRCVVCGTFVCSSIRDLLEHMSFCKGKEVFACPDCRLTFPIESIAQYHKHMQLHAKKNSYLQTDSNNQRISGFCMLCKEKFDGLHEIHAHDCCDKDKTKFSYASCATNPDDDTRKRFQCASCGKSYKNFYVLVKHLENQRASGVFKCPDCSKNFKTKSSMQFHHRTVHKRKTAFLCDTCGKSYSTKGGLKVHKMVHSNDKPYVCSICNHACRQKINLEYHMRKHTGVKPFVCKLCGKRFQSSNQCRSHENSHTGKRPYKCPICEKAFAGWANLYMHKTVHDDNKPKNIICHLCGKAFAHKVRYSAHMKCHRGDYKKYDLASPSQEKFVCDQCPYTTCYKSYFRSHLRSHSEERPFQCKKCGKAFKWASGLYIHKRIHTQEKPYKCSVCLKEFTYSDSFKKHFRQHEEGNSKCN